MITMITDKYTPIHLEQMEKVKLMNRMDRKFCIHSALLPVLCDNICNDYYVLEINGQCRLPYTTKYYDTENDDMLNDHLRGRLNRYKIRFRKYEITGTWFFEIKHKTNKSKTFKTRLLCEGEHDFYSPNIQDFIKKKSPYGSLQLSPVLQSTFNRITLVSKNFNERCTIDLHVGFENKKAKGILENIVIIEVKSERYNKDSFMLKMLRQLNYISPGFSKYCFGRSLLMPSLKSNNYKHKIREIGKLSNLYN